MKRVQILLDDETHEALRREARRLQRSESDLARETLAERFRPLPPLEEDAIWKMRGIADFEPVREIDG
ncbi:MAG: hypothetical protein WEB00_03970 [Dehalococcoidia bacterium]